MRLSREQENLLLDKLLTELSDPSQWHKESCTIVCKEMEIWTANMPWIDCALWRPAKITFRLWNRWKLYLSVRRVANAIEQREYDTRVARVLDTLDLSDDLNADTLEYETGDWMK